MLSFGLYFFPLRWTSRNCNIKKISHYILYTAILLVSKIQRRNNSILQPYAHQSDAPSLIPSAVEVVHSPEWLPTVSVFPCSIERMLNTSLLFKDLMILKKEPNAYIILILKSHQSLKWFKQECGFYCIKDGTAKVCNTFKCR